MNGPARKGNLFASLGRLLATVLEMAQVRLDLLGTEFEFEKRRIFDGLMWGGVALLLLGIGLVFLCGFITLLFWENYRLPAVGVMALLFLAGSALFMRGARKRLRNPKGTFSTSVAELEHDRARLQASAQHEQR